MCLRNSKKWDNIVMGDPLPHHHLPTKHLVVIVNCGRQGDQNHRMNYPFYFSYVVFLEYTKNLYRHSFIDIGAFPNITKNTRSYRILSRLDELPGNDMGGW